eukprot:jgi/Picre1/35089/NNA_002552.t1
MDYNDSGKKKNNNIESYFGQDRFNSSESREVTVDMFGSQIVLRQDPCSRNLGTTVWDASIVLAKYVEKNFSGKSRVKGKTVVELGAGVSGLVGMSFALQGAHVTVTDITDAVLDTLRHNVEYNLSPATLRLNQSQMAGAVGQVNVVELDWSIPSHFERVSPPVDYIVAADCVYNEDSVSMFLDAVQALFGPRSIGLVCNEFRSESVHAEFMSKFSKHFSMKKVPSSKMDKQYIHPLIHIYILKRLKTAV